MEFIIELTSAVILPALMLGYGYYLSKTTPPPHFDTWEEIEAKANQK